MPAQGNTDSASALTSARAPASDSNGSSGAGAPPVVDGKTLSGAWRAINRARHSAGSIHDDETARKLGFRGGFVGGVTLVSYACEAWRRAEQLGFDLKPFRLTVELRAPVYQDELARVWGADTGGGWDYVIDTEQNVASARGIIDARAPEWPVLPALPATVELDGIDLSGIPPVNRAFSREEAATYYRDVLDTAPPEEGALPVSIGMWSNPMTPVIARLQATHTTVHYGSEMYVHRLPQADETCSFVTSVEAVTPRANGKTLVHLRCEIRDQSGDPVALIQHRSAVRKRD